MTERWKNVLENVLDRELVLDREVKDMWVVNKFLCQRGRVVVALGVLMGSLLALTACQNSPLLGLGTASHKPILLGQHTPGVAPAIVAIPDVLEVLSVDNETVPLFSRGSAKTIALPPGERVLSVRYLNAWKIDSDNNEVVRSDTVRVRANFRSGTRYHFEKPPFFNKPEAAWVYAETFVPKLLRDRQTVFVGVKPDTTGPRRALAQNAGARVLEPLVIESDVLENDVLESDVLEKNRIKNNSINSNGIEKALTEAADTAALDQGAEESLALELKELQPDELEPETVQKAAELRLDESLSPVVESMKVLWQQLSERERTVFTAWLMNQNKAYQD
ncbi:MAG: DUF2057 family protein [Gammaproteobacteria bacterium]